MVSDKKAEELEKRCLWRRAAARWNDVLMEFQQEEQIDQRRYIKQQIQRCVDLAISKSIESKGGGTKAIRKAAVCVEKEMGIYRDRKIVHGELYVHKK